MINIYWHNLPFSLFVTIVFPLDSSKQRHHLHNKTSEEKSDLARLISEYNGLATTDGKVEIADALDNNFPWALHDQTGGK